VSVESEIVTLLAADGGVSALVVARIYPLILPQDPTLPAITYARVTTSRIYSSEGYSNLDNAMIQVDCWASTYAGAKALGTAVLSAMDGSSTFSAVLIDERDMFEDDVEIYRVSMDFSTWNTE